METPHALRYTNEHEWIKEEDGKVRVGISDYAQMELGDVVFVELPEVGRSVAKGDACVVVESVKAVSDVYAPVSGTVVAVNDALPDSPDKINASPYDDGWMVVIEPSDLSEVESLMSGEAYENFISELSK